MRTVKVFTGEVMAFHHSKRATGLCVCTVKSGIGYDAFGGMWEIITDDYGNTIFIKCKYRRAL